MKFFYRINILKIFVLVSDFSYAGNWCKAIYNQDISEGDFKNKSVNAEIQITFS